MSGDRSRVGSDIVSAQGFQHRLHDVRRIETGLIILLLRRLLVLEMVRKPHGAELQSGVDQPFVTCQGQDMSPETAYRCFLDRDRNLMAREQLADQLLV